LDDHCDLSTHKLGFFISAMGVMLTPTEN
jgi:hypothetical protein